MTNGPGNARGADIRNLLVPKDDHPARDLIHREFSLHELGESARPLPWGMVWEPRSCENYLEIAIPESYSLNGWLRSTDRTARNFRHDNFYIDMVVEVPGGADVDRIREAAGTCRSGTLTLDDKVTGTITYTDIDTPSLRNLRGGKAIAMQINLNFEPAQDDETAAILAKYGYGDGRQGVRHEKTVTYATTGDALFMVMSPNRGLGERMAHQLHQRAVEAGLA